MTVENQVEEQPQKASLLKRPIGGSGKKAAPAPKAGKFGIPPRPQVNLMPPEVLEGRKVAILRRKLVWVIIALLLLVVLAFAGAFLVRGAADQRYEDALTQSDTLLAQKKQYAPVIQVQADITATTNARTFGLSTEVEWTSLVYSIQAVLPKGVTIDALDIEGIDPGEDLAAGADDLTQPGIAVISFSALSENLPDASEWILALQSVPGLADANLQSSVLQEEGGVTGYLVSATVQVTQDVLANRTFPDTVTTTDATDDGN